MAKIIIENVPESIVKTYGTKINYTKDLIFPKKRKSRKVTLLEYINSDEYKNDKGEIFSSGEEFLSDLHKYKN